MTVRWTNAAIAHLVAIHKHIGVVRVRSRAAHCYRLTNDLYSR